MAGDEIAATERSHQLIDRYRVLDESYDTADARCEILLEFAALDLEPDRLEQVLLDLLREIDLKSPIRTDAYAATGGALAALWESHPERLANVRDLVQWEDNPALLQALIRACATHRDSDHLIGFDEDLYWLQTSEVADEALRTMIAGNSVFFASRWGTGGDALIENLGDVDVRIPSIHSACIILDAYDRRPDKRRISPGQRDAMLQALVDAAVDPALRPTEVERIKAMLGGLSPDSIAWIDDSVFEKLGISRPSPRND